MSATELRLALDWELWVVEHLLFTGKRDDLVDALVTHGIERDQAVAQVSDIEASPGFARLKARVAEGDLASRLLRLADALHPEGVPSQPNIDPADLLQHHWIASRPLHLTEVARAIPAVSKWSLAWLAEHFGAEALCVNHRRTEALRPSDTEQHHCEMPVADFVSAALAGARNDLYVVSRNGLLSRPAFRPLWGDLEPLPPILVAQEPPRGVSLWIGPAGTVTPPHFDPHNVLLVQVEGRKRVRLAPRLKPHQHDWVDGYYLRGSLDRLEPLTVELGPGEALFVPVGWFHEVTALDPSMTLSFLGFPWPNHFHWLGPPGSDDARP